jgi:hypothetical protein
MRRALLLTLLLLVACGREDPIPRSEGENVAAIPVPAAPPANAVPVVARDGEGREKAEGAARMLRRYYDHLEAGRYREAWQMRGGGEEGFERFTRNFATYDRYRVTLGPPTPPVEADGWTFVEVPIQILGTLKGGKGFGSVGSVTMRRASGAPNATERQRDWHIYTG